MRTLVDGNNLLYAIPPLRKLMIGKQTDAARSGLVALLSRLVKSGRLRAPVTVVFDGRASAPVAADAEAGGIEVRFAPHPDTADRVIGDLVENGVDFDEYAVVTSDREVQSRVRRFGAKVVSIWKFLREYVPEAGRGFRKARGRNVGLRPGPTGGRGRGKTTRPGAPEKPKGGLPDFEVERWMREFGLEE
ncbi:MAG: NYN domain-containing protein [Planctomycetota bacterium]|jgi:predicted RNA-binding protein with PIN domain